MSGGGAADSGQAAASADGGGWGVGSLLSGLGTMVGIGPSIAALEGAPAPLGRDPLGALKQSATNAVLGQYPGYGSLWTYDSSGLHVTQTGWVAIGAAGFGLWWVLR